MPSLDDRERLYETENPRLYGLIKSGDVSVLDEMIVVNQDLVQDRVAAYIKRNEDMAYLADDLASEAMLVLISEVRSLPGKHSVGKPTGYLTTAIDRAIIEAASTDGTISVKRKSKQRAQAKGRPIVLRRTPTLYDCHAAPNENAATDLILELSDYCSNDVEIEIVKLRGTGMTLKDISVQVDRPYSYVTRTLAHVKEEYDKAREEEEEEVTK